MRKRLDECVSDIAWTPGKFTCHRARDQQVWRLIVTVVRLDEIVLYLALPHLSRLAVALDTRPIEQRLHRIVLPMEGTWAVVDRHYRGRPEDGFFEVVSFYNGPRFGVGCHSPRWRLEYAA